MPLSPAYVPGIFSDGPILQERGAVLVKKVIANGGCQIGKPLR